MSDRRSQSIDTIPGELAADLSVTALDQINAPDIIIDIRPPDEQDVKPLKATNAQVHVIPFYALNKQFTQLDMSKHYYLYCQKGVMSQLHAANLKNAGHLNVGVYRPDAKSACAIA